MNDINEKLNEFFIAKIAILFHDPIPKILSFYYNYWFFKDLLEKFNKNLLEEFINEKKKQAIGHEEFSFKILEYFTKNDKKLNNFLKKIKNKRNIKIKVVKIPDHIASSASRVITDAMYKYRNIKSRVFFNIFNSCIILYDTEDKLYEKKEFLKTSINFYNEINKFFNIIYSLNINEKYRYRILYMVLYTVFELCYLKNFNKPIMEDTRAPYIEIIDHLYASLNVFNLAYNPKLEKISRKDFTTNNIYVYLDVSGLKKTITNSIKFKELWFSSWITSILVWKIIEPFLLYFGPDILVLPTCRLNPLWICSLVNYLEMFENDNFKNLINEILKLYSEVISGLSKDDNSIIDIFLHRKNKKLLVEDFSFAFIPGTIVFTLPYEMINENPKILYDVYDLFCKINHIEKKDLKISNYKDLINVFVDQFLDNFEEKIFFNINLSKEEINFLKNIFKIFFKITETNNIEIKFKEYNKEKKTGNYWYLNLKEIYNNIDNNLIKNNLNTIDVDPTVYHLILTKDNLKNQNKRCSCCKKLPTYISSNDNKFKKYLKEKENLCEYCLIKRILSEETSKLFVKTDKTQKFDIFKILFPYITRKELANQTLNRMDLNLLSLIFAHQTENDKVLEKIIEKYDNSNFNIKGRYNDYIKLLRECSLSLKDLYDKLYYVYFYADGDYIFSILRGKLNSIFGNYSDLKYLFKLGDSNIEELSKDFFKVLYQHLLRTDFYKFNKKLEEKKEELENNIYEKIENYINDNKNKLCVINKNNFIKSFIFGNNNEKIIDKTLIIGYARAPIYSTIVSKSLLISSLKEYAIVKQRNSNSKFGKFIYLIYSGGDDILGIAIPYFREEFNFIDYIIESRLVYSLGTSKIDEKSPIPLGAIKLKNNYVPTIGVGGKCYTIYFVYYNYPLSVIRKDSIEMAKNLKHILWIDPKNDDLINLKDSIGFSIITPSRQIIRSILFSCFKDIEFLKRNLTPREINQKFIDNFKFIIEFLNKECLTKNLNLYYNIIPHIKNIRFFINSYKENQNSINDLLNYLNYYIFERHKTKMDGEDWLKKFIENKDLKNMLAYEYYYPSIDFILKINDNNLFIELLKLKKILKNIKLDSDKDVV